MTERKRRPPGALGIEIHGWIGIGIDRDLFHRYVRLGVVTLYVSSTPLHHFLRMMKAARDVLRGSQDGAASKRGHGWESDNARGDDVEGR